MEEAKGAEQEEFKQHELVAKLSKTKISGSSLLNDENQDPNVSKAHKEDKRQIAPLLSGLGAPISTNSQVVNNDPTPSERSSKR